MNRLFSVIFVLLLAPLALFAQDKGSLSNDYPFSKVVVGTGDEFIVYESYQDISKCTLDETKSVVWAVKDHSSTLLGIDLTRIGTSQVEHTIQLSFTPIVETEGVVCSPDGQYVAMLERASRPRLHIISTSTNKEVCSIILKGKISSPETCHFRFISDRVVAVAGPYFVQKIDIGNASIKSVKTDLAMVKAVTSLGDVSGIRMVKVKGSKTPKRVACYYNIKSKKYHEGTVADRANFVRVCDNENVNRYYVRKSTGEKMPIRMDNKKAYGITDNCIIKSKAGEPGIHFNDYTCLGWSGGDKYLVLVKSHNVGGKTYFNIAAADYTRIDLEFQKQFLVASTQNLELHKVSSYLNTHPSSPYRQLALDRMYASLESDRSRRHSYNAVRSFFAPYSQMKDTVERLLAVYVRDKYDAGSFIDEYPVSKYRKVAFSFAFKTREIDAESLGNLIRDYGPGAKLGLGDPISILDDDTKQHYMQSMYHYTNPRNIDKAQDFYFQYDWVNYSGKGDDLLGNYWEILDRDPSMKGDLQVGFLKDVLPELDVYQSWGVDKDKASAFVDQKLREVFNGNVSISKMEVTSSTSPDWEDWLNSSYTAGIVTQNGHRQFLVYGTVTNKTDYSLPVKVNAGSCLFINSEAKGTGLVSGILAALFSAGQQEKLLAQASESFYIPSLAPHSTSIYAVLLDFGDGSISAGLNVADWIKVYQHVYLKNTMADVFYSTDPVSKTQLAKQDEWQKFAQNGLPSNQLTDFLRGERVDESVWNDRHIEKLRKQAERRARAAAYASSSSSSNSSIKLRPIEEYYKYSEDIRLPEYEVSCNGGQWYSTWHVVQSTVDYSPIIGTRLTKGHWYSVGLLGRLLKKTICFFSIRGYGKYLV